MQRMKIERKKAALNLIALGYTNEQIAFKERMSLSAVKNDVKRLMDTIGASSRLELALWRLNAHAQLN